MKLIANTRMLWSLGFDAWSAVFQELHFLAGRAAEKAQPSDWNKTDYQFARDLITRCGRHCEPGPLAADYWRESPGDPPTQSAG